MARRTITGVLWEDLIRSDKQGSSSSGCSVIEVAATALGGWMEFLRIFVPACLIYWVSEPPGFSLLSFPHLAKGIHSGREKLSMLQVENLMKTLWSIHVGGGHCLFLHFICLSETLGVARIQTISRKKKLWWKHFNFVGLGLYCPDGLFSGSHDQLPLSWKTKETTFFTNNQRENLIKPGTQFKKKYRLCN